MHRTHAVALLMAGVAALSAGGGAARGERVLSAVAYADQIKGMWVGQLLGNYAGRQVEGLTIVKREGPDVVNKPITDYQVQWNAILQGRYYDSGGTLLGNATWWLGDDDTFVEYLYAHALQSKASLSVAERTALWDTGLAGYGLYFANLQSRLLIHRHGMQADQAGTPRNNMCSYWTIDSQIATESLGAIAPGMRVNAAALAGDFGGITNSGYPLHAAQFYASMYAQAPFATNVEDLVADGLQCVPQGSWTRSLIEHAVGRYQADKADDGLLNGWLASRNGVLDFAQQRGRLMLWTQSATNTALTALAVLYGQGSFQKTVEYGVRGGQDSDCNPATAGGLVGLMKGYDAVVSELSSSGFGASAIPQSYTPNGNLTYLGGQTLATVVGYFQTAAETQIAATLGASAITGVGADRQYHLPDPGTGADSLSPAPIVYPSGPRGLVGAVRSMGGTVTVRVVHNGALYPNNPSLDVKDYSSLTDGIIDVSNSGAMPFCTYDCATAPSTDMYELHFDRPVLLDQVFVHEGGILEPMNCDPRSPSTPPLGCFFKDLAVQVLQGSTWVAVSCPALSEPLDANAYFQSILVSFGRIAGTAVRVAGLAGGQYPSTSLTELEAFGLVAWEGDSDMDGDVDYLDYYRLRTNFGGQGVGWLGGDCNFDGVVDRLDYAAMWTNYGQVSQLGAGQYQQMSPQSAPEPGALLLMCLGATGLAVRRWK